MVGSIHILCHSQKLTWSGLRPGSGFALGAISLPAYLLAWMSLRHTASGSCHQHVFFIRWGWKAPSTAVGLWLHTLPGHGQTGLQGQQNSSYEGPNQADLYHPIFLVWVCPDLVLLVRTTTWALQVGTPFPRFKCLVLQTPPCFSVTVRFPGVEPHRFPCDPHCVRSE